LAVRLQIWLVSRLARKDVNLVMPYLPNIEFARETLDAELLNALHIGFFRINALVLRAFAPDEMRRNC